MNTAILIVEDDPLIAIDLETIVTGTSSAEITVCASLAEACKALERCKIAYALIDVDVMDGKTFPLARQLRARRIPFTFVTAADLAEIYAAMGEVAVISKPYRAEDVRRSIETATSVI